MTTVETGMEEVHPMGRRAQVLQLLREAKAPLSIAQVAERLGVHANTVRFHLNTLLVNGQVEQVASEPGALGRPAKLFQAARGMDPMGPRHYRVLAEVLATSLSTGPDSHGELLAAGRAWGRAHAGTPIGTSSAEGSPEAARSVEQLIQMLDDLDFAPEHHDGDDGARIGLRNCPFLEVAVDRSGVVCPIHLGLMQGAMASWGSPVTVDRLDVFIEPDLCVAHLTTAAR